MKIDSHEIGPGHPVFCVADVSASHEGDIETAKRLIEYAACAGADAVKFQAYTPDDMCPESTHPAYDITSGPWAGKTLRELYAEAPTPYKWFPELFDCATSHNITMFASVFSVQGVNMLEDLGCPAYKIASGEITDLPLLRYVAATKKPIVMSTGMATDMEIGQALIEMGKAGAEDVVLLHCVSSYPSPPECMDMRKLLVIQATAAGLPVGLSDHSKSTVVPPIAVAMGADIIEKHIMDYRPNTSLDRGFALDPDEFEAFVVSVRDTEKALSRPTDDAEKDSRQFRRRLVYTENVYAGDLITPENTRTARCSQGIYPVRLEENDMIADVDAKAGDPVI